jgi:hypothetical protein
MVRYSEHPGEFQDVSTAGQVGGVPVTGRDRNPGMAVNSLLPRRAVVSRCM